MDLNHPLLALAADDPPPFPSAFPQLQRLDRAVICPICKELFSAPVSISCGHSFCSSCIRSSLDVMKDKKCPSCGETTSEGSIRRNRALEEMSDAWEAARPTLITLSQPPKKRPVPMERHSSSSKRQRQDSGSRHSTPSDVEIIEAEDDPVSLTEKDDAPCPLCGAEMPIGAIPMHVERGCPPVKSRSSVVAGSGNQKADWKKVFAGAGKGKDPEMKRITKPNYTLSSPADLRSMLTDYGLATTGDKEALKSRLQEWIVLYNANLDRTQPRSLASLRAQLTEAENARRRDKEKGKEDAVKELGTKEGIERYAKEKRSEFERLRREIQERDASRASGADENHVIEVE